MNNNIYDLINKYPYAFAHNAWTGEMCYDREGFPYLESDSLPKGWYNLFWQCMEDIREPLEKAGLLDKFYFTQVKEKYGSMRLYNNGTTKEVMDILSQYEYLSQFVCETCGKPATITTRGWILNLCDECGNKYQDADKIDDFNLILKRTTYSKDGDTTEEFDLTDKWNRLYKNEAVH